MKSYCKYIGLMLLPLFAVACDDGASKNYIDMPRPAVHTRGNPQGAGSRHSSTFCANTASQLMFHILISFFILDKYVIADNYFLNCLQR